MWPGEGGQLPPPTELAGRGTCGHRHAHTRCKGCWKPGGHPGPASPFSPSASSCGQPCWLRLHPTYRSSPSCTAAGPWGGARAPSVLSLPPLLPPGGLEGPRALPQLRWLRASPSPSRGFPRPPDLVGAPGPPGPHWRLCLRRVLGSRAGGPQPQPGACVHLPGVPSPPTTRTCWRRAAPRLLSPELFLLCLPLQRQRPYPHGRGTLCTFSARVKGAGAGGRHGAAAVVLGVLSEEVACGGCGGSRQLSGEGEGARAEPLDLRGLCCGGWVYGGASCMVQSPGQERSERPPHEGAVSLGPGATRPEGMGDLQVTLWAGHAVPPGHREQHRAASGRGHRCPALQQPVQTLNLSPGLGAHPDSENNSP